MPTHKNKVVAYITHGDRLLVFRHTQFPEAGIQVPAGTVEEGEDPDVAVLREATEETGLTDLDLVSLLGEQVRDMSDYGRDEIHHRRFYHVRCTGDPPVTWRHLERSPADGTPDLIAREYSPGTRTCALACKESRRQSTRKLRRQCRSWSSRRKSIHRDP